MAQKITGLGRGLDSIFLDNSGESSNGIQMLRIADVGPRADQPRKVFDADSLSALSESISAYGLIEPIIVRTSSGGFYEIVAGERRWRAAKMAGLSEIPAIIGEYDDKKTAEIALIENIQRQDLNPVEEAMGYKALIEEYGFSQEEISKRIGKSRPAVTNSLRLLELPENIVTMLSRGEITAGHARALLGLEDLSKAYDMAGQIVKADLSVRATEELVRRANRKEKTPAPGKLPNDGADGVDYIGRLEKRAQKLLGRKVVIKNGKSKRVELTFENDDDLEELLTALCGKDIFDK